MFTEIFIEILEERNITPYQVAKHTGISQGLMGEYSRGEKLPTTKNLIKIADYLDCSVDYLLGRTDDPKSIYKNIQSSNVINGNNGNNSPLTVNGTNQLDEIETELLKNFRQISFPDKLRVVSDVMKKAESKK